MRLPIWWAAAAFLTASAAVLAFDRWYGAHLEAEARVAVARTMGPTASALRSAVERRVALLDGLRSFAEAQPTRARLDAEFPTFAQGIVLSAEGVRALQFVERGVIVDTWPLAGNERALGYNLLADPREEISGDVRRAMSTDSVVVTGPIVLVQGGDGLLVRRRLARRLGFPDLSAIILDVPSIVREAGLPDRRTGLYLEVRDRQGRWFGGDTLVAGLEPEILRVQVPDGDWTLRAAPIGGWTAVLAPQRRAARAASVVAVLALTLIGVLIGLRQSQMADVLARRTARLGVALKAGKMGTWELDVRGDRLHFDANGAAILGRPPHEVDGSLEKLFAVLHPQDAAFVARVFLEILGSDRSEYTLEHRIILPDGGERWVLVIGEIERDAAGNAPRAQGIISDASDRRAIEARARHLERVETIGTMAGGVAHDFNNLLTAIISFTELAKESLGHVEADPQLRAVREDLDEALKVAARARGLAAQLLAFSRGAASEPRRADLARTVAELEPLLRRLLGKRIILHIDVVWDVPPVWIDPSQFTQVVLNLVVNARDAIADRGEVTLRLQRLTPSAMRPSGAPAGDWVALEVADSGVGMDESLRRRIFEPYFTTKAEARGTGLGLAVVHGVVRSAGGQALVESTPGQGSRFWIFLPPFAGDEMA
ncbi:MAG: PAS domain-containing protein [Gemmatimonadaceae bacterium]|nr:PAS domain-containing protein [Gemmatimonadaceae bacterium]MCW5824962.1 PAS domain-containing protein [Gemmatimonadaceae bacterium]